MKANLKARQPRCLETKQSFLTVNQRASTGGDRRNKLRPIYRVAEVDANWPHRRGVPESQPHRMREVIQLIRAIEFALCGVGKEHRLRRVRPQSHPPKPAIHISPGIKKRPPRGGADERPEQSKSKI